jgi:hypothetical protein
MSWSNETVRQAEMLSLLESAIDNRRTLRDRANGHRDRRTFERKDPHRPRTEHADSGHADNAESLLHADVAGCQPDEGPKQEARDEADPLGARRRAEPLPRVLLRRAQLVVDWRYVFRLAARIPTGSGTFWPSFSRSNKTLIVRSSSVISRLPLRKELNRGKSSSERARQVTT